MIDSAFKAFEELEATSSTLGKQQIIHSNKDNGIFKELLRLAYNPYKIYHLKKFDMPEKAVWQEFRSTTINYWSFKDLLVALEERAITGNDAIQSARFVFSDMSELERKWYLRVLQKDLNVGIQAKSINKVIPDLIPVFGVMLAQPFRSYPDMFILEPKYDGMRILGDTSTGELFSRKGKRVEGFDLIEEEIRKLPSGYMIDGELLAGAKGKKIQTFNNLMTQAFAKTSGKQGILFAFDLFFKDGDPRNQLDRINELNKMFSEFSLFSIKKTPSSEVISEARYATRYIESFYNKCLNDGFEGVIVKDLDGSYEFKRSYNWQKIKPIETYDLPVIAIESGGDDTKYEEMVGALVCDFNGVEVRVGSGLSDAQRLDWFMNPDKIVGKTIEVIAQEKTENKQGTTSLRFPRLKLIREDK
jgi:DNA ligase 1